MTADPDYIVVGAGSAGCVVARRLADAGFRVVLLEAGGSGADDPRIRAPERYAELQGSGEDWRYQTEPEAELEGRRIPWPRGKVLGGSSSMSNLIYVRGNRRDFDRWARNGCPGWGYGDSVGLFRRSERNLRPGIDASLHGLHGAMTVTDIDPPNPASLAFVEAAAQAGYGRKADFNDGEQVGGAGIYQVNIDERGDRVSAATAFLKRAPDNLEVRLGVEVARLRIEEGRAVGVEVAPADDLGRVGLVRARREVIVSCGTVNSPKLLMLSGLGPASALRRLGLAVVADLPGVGQNLQDHPIAAISTLR